MRLYLGDTRNKLFDFASANPMNKKEYIIYMKGFWVYTYLDQKQHF